jgi:hypothetical protein
MITRAIYLPDIRYNTMLIFELKEDKFICVTDSGFFYPVETVLSDSDWMVVSINDDEIENVR